MQTSENLKEEDKDGKSL